MYSDACDAEASKGLPWIWTLTKIYSNIINTYLDIIVSNHDGAYKLQ